MTNVKNLIVIIGPTAVGKTKLCVDLAKYFGFEIVSADSRQFYKEMSIGTAKPTEEEMGGIPHHLIDNLSIDTSYDIGKYEKDALTVIENIFINSDSAILTGGSGLYIDAVCKGFDEMPEVSQDVRNQLNSEYTKGGLKALVIRLKSVDMAYYNQVDLNNPQRVIRALEVYETTGRPYSQFRKSIQKIRPFNIIKIGLDRERDELYMRIDQRMDEMIDQGLFNEVEGLMEYKSNNALQTVGYKEVFSYLNGEYGKNEAVRLLKRNSRRYAKRQLTWFRRDEYIKWFHPNDIIEIKSYLSNLID